MPDICGVIAAPKRTRAPILVATMIRSFNKNKPSLWRYAICAAGYDNNWQKGTSHLAPANAGCSH